MLLALIRDYRQGLAVRLGVTFVPCVLAYLAVSSPRFLDALGPLQIPALVLAAATMPVFWMFSRAWYDDEFRVGRREYGLAAGSILAIFLHEFVFQPMGGFGSRATFLIGQITGYGFAGDALWQAWSRCTDDLIEGRRRARLLFVGLIGIYAVALTTTEAFYGWSPPLESWVVVNMAGIAALVLVLASVLLRLGDPGLFPRPRAMPEAAPALDAEEEKLAQRLDHLMTHDRVYREDGLVIASLAQRLGVPEYRLRRLINQRLGHRNFNSYLNSYRIGEARHALADPTQRKVPVLTVALDAGFASLGPFNRAFKDAYGVTPTEFRRQEFAKTENRQAESEIR